MYNKGKYIIIQSLLIVLSPISSLLVSLRMYKSTISQIFFVLFAIYLGYYMGFVYDLMRHFQDLPMLYRGRDWNEIVNDFRVYYLGSDYYHIIVKYIVSRFTDSRQVFGAVASGLYAISFVFFFRQFRRYYLEKNSYFSVVLLLCVSTVVEFFWYQGFRFWIGVYVFMGFYIKFINTKNYWYLLGTLLAMFFHFTLVVLVGTVVLNRLLAFTGKYVRWLLVGFSLFIKSLNIDFVPLMLRYIPWTNGLGIALTDEKIRGNTLEHMAEMREMGNSVYNNRMTFMIFCGLLFMLFLRKIKVPFDKHYGKMFYFAMTLYTIANFGYGDITFYTRFLQAAVLMFYCYLFIISVKNKRAISKYSMTLFIVALLPLGYSVAIALAQIRAYLFHPELIFGNFFMEWDGNALNIDYDW